MAMQPDMRLQQVIELGICFFMILCRVKMKVETAFGCHLHLSWFLFESCHNRLVAHGFLSHLDKDFGIGR